MMANLLDFPDSIMPFHRIGPKDGNGFSKMLPSEVKEQEIG